MPNQPPKGRQRRFALPDLNDERAHAGIEDFMARPATPAPNRPTRRGSATVAVVRAPLEALDSPRAWHDAVRREGARVARYGRSASVVVVEVVPREDVVPGRRPWTERLAEPIAHVLRGQARETDRIARTTETRFHVLLPETPDAAARRYVERVRTACDLWLEATAAPVQLRVGLASTGEAVSLADALRLAEAQLSDSIVRLA